MEKKIRLKKKPIIILAVGILLFIFLIVLCVKACSKKEEEVEILKKETTFIETFTNNTTEGIDEKIKKKIIDFFDIYYLSIKELNEYDMTYLFDDELESYINQSAMHFLINYRLMQRTDLKLDKCKYNLKVSKVTKDEDEITLLVLEDSIFNFNFMKDISSKTYNVENTFVFKE